MTGDVSYHYTHRAAVLEDYSDSFVKWVTSGETLCH